MMAKINVLFFCLLNLCSMVQSASADTHSYWSEWTVCYGNNPCKRSRNRVCPPDVSWDLCDMSPPSSEEESCQCPGTDSCSNHETGPFCHTGGWFDGGNCAGDECTQNECCQDKDSCYMLMGFEESRARQYCERRTDCHWKDSKCSDLAVDKKLQCSVAQGTEFTGTFCRGTDDTGRTFRCEDSTGSQIKKDRTEGEIDCAGVVCYNDGSLFGTCKGSASSDTHSYWSEWTVCYGDSTCKRSRNRVCPSDVSWDLCDMSPPSSEEESCQCPGTDTHSDWSEWTADSCSNHENRKFCDTGRWFDGGDCAGDACTQNECCESVWPCVTLTGAEDYMKTLCERRSDCQWKDATQECSDLDYWSEWTECYESHTNDGTCKRARTRVCPPDVSSDLCDSNLSSFEEESCQCPGTDWVMCEPGTILDAQKWHAVVALVEANYLPDGDRRRNLNNPKDLIEELKEMIEGGKILNVEF